MAARLVDVAARAGVSIKTVSNVVHGYSHITPSTRARVQKALDELGYRPHVGARNLRRGRTGFIGLGLPQLDIPYFAELAKLVITAAEECDFTVLITQTGGRRDRELAVLDGTAIQAADATILIPLNIEPDDVDASPPRMPVVLLAEHLQDVPLDHVDIDNSRAAQVATEHLISLGRRRIAAIGAQPWQIAGTAQLRLSGYRAALHEAGLVERPELIVAARDYHRDEGAAAIKELLRLDEPPDAVFCFNDLLAIGALRGALEMGVQVPDDLALIGFDDIEEAAYTVPSLSTISPDKAEIAAAAVRLIGERLDPVPRTERSYVRTEFALTVRESSARPLKPRRHRRNSLR